MSAGVAVAGAVPLPATGYRRALAGLGALVQGALRVRLRCLILGHEDAFARQPRRLMLRCATCGRETVGWAIGPGSSAAITARPTLPARRPAPIDTAVRIGPWTLRRWDRRGERRERERQRLVAAASRACEPRAAAGRAPRPEGLGLIAGRPGAAVAHEAAAPVRAVAERLA